MTNQAIDMWAPLLPVPSMIRHAVEHFPQQMLGYLKVFYKQTPSLESFRKIASNIAMSEEDVLSALEAAGIGRSLITGFDEKISCGETFMPNEPVLDLFTRYPGRFIPFCGVDILRGMEGVRELSRLVQMGFVGLSLRPFMINLPADDRRYYPFYAKCVELDIPVSIHTSANWTTMRDNDLGHPRHIGVVAADFPELRIIMSHAGYPWILEACMLAWKHENVYLELAAHRPKYLAEPGTGWEPLLRFGQTTIADKILFGTGWFLLGRPPVAVTDEFRSLPIRKEILEKWMHSNAERVLRRSQR